MPFHSILEFCQWIQNTEPATALRQSTLAFPLIEGTHVLSLAISVGIVMFLDLRLLGFIFRDVPVSRLMKQVAPWMIAGMCIMFVTGLMLFVAQAKNAYTNYSFRIKITLLILAGLNAVIYQLRYYPKMAEWDLGEYVPTGVKAIAWVSLIFWFLIIIMGRTMAYEI